MPFLAGLLDEIETLHPGLEPARIVHELARRVITRFVEDVIRESERRIAALAPATVADIHAAGAPVVAFSPTIEAADAEVMRFLWKRMYRDASVVAVREKAAAIVTDLFTAFKADPSRMPPEWSADLAGASEPRIARRIADYIAGMTDTYAVLAHRKLFDATPELLPSPPSRGLPWRSPSRAGALPRPASRQGGDGVARSVSRKPLAPSHAVCHAEPHRHHLRQGPFRGSRGAGHLHHGWDPDPETSLEVLRALPGAGADILEFGMPFTDPMADGPAIQAAGLRALKAGQDVAKTLGLARRFRAENDTTPIVLMGYYNPIHTYGVDRFLADAVETGSTG